MHFLLLPFTAQGHFSPMLHLASHLLRADCSVTFVITEQCSSSMLAAQSAPTPQPRLRFVTIPDPSAKVDMSIANVVQTVQAMQQQHGVLEELIRSSRTTDDPISCIVFDLLLLWVHDVADKFRITRAILWITSATLVCLMAAQAEHPETFDLDDFIRPLGVAKVQLLTQKNDDSAFQLLKRGKECSHILVNSFHELEAPFIAEAPANLTYIGPCLPEEVYKGKASDVALQGNFLKEDVECLGWLDAQEDNSVLYISFGSLAYCARTQIEEVALGVEASNQKFLWVARPDMRANSDFPEGFEERTRGRGRIISWGPQLKVLEHRAVGAFLTHCGWNSIMEGIFMGVPMICFPVFVEQPLLAELVVNTWQVGMGFHKREDGVVDRGEMERVVRSMMEGEEGQRIKRRSLLLKGVSRGAVKPGGSSHQALASFVQKIQALTGTATTPPSS